jgi:CRP/FNR family transcriptional regulator, cyclic AMP receptor protein
MLEPDSATRRHRKAVPFVHEDALSKVSLFSGLSHKELQELSVNAREREYAPGEALVRQGETGVGLFVVLNGKVRVFQQADGGERELGVFGKDAVLGELALLDDLPRSATMVATEPSKVLIIPVWDFRAALRENPEISLKLLAVLSQRLRKVESHI